MITTLSTVETKLNNNKYFVLNNLMGQPCHHNKKTRNGRVLIWITDSLWTNLEKDRKTDAAKLSKHAKELGATYLRYVKLENIKLEHHQVYHGAVSFYIKSI
jgi:hypothetical protein